jgi:hypothetical protein
MTGATARPSRRAQPEQESDRELFAALGGGDVEGDHARERR